METFSWKRKTGKLVKHFFTCRKCVQLVFFDIIRPSIRETNVLPPGWRKYITERKNDSAMKTVLDVLPLQTIEKEWKRKRKQGIEKARKNINEKIAMTFSTCSTPRHRSGWYWIAINQQISRKLHFLSAPSFLSYL